MNNKRKFTESFTESFNNFDYSKWTTYSYYNRVKLITLNRDLHTTGLIEGANDVFIAEVLGYGNTPVYGLNTFNNTTFDKHVRNDISYIDPYKYITYDIEQFYVDEKPTYIYPTNKRQRSNSIE